MRLADCAAGSGCTVLLPGCPVPVVVRPDPELDPLPYPELEPVPEPVSAPDPEPVLDPKPEPELDPAPEEYIEINWWLRSRVVLVSFREA